MLPLNVAIKSFLLLPLPVPMRRFNKFSLRFALFTIDVMCLWM